MPEHTSFLTYFLAMFPALRENAQHLGGTFPPPSQQVNYHGLEPIFASMLVIVLVTFLAVGIRGELKAKTSVVPDDTLTTRTFFEVFVNYFYTLATDVMGPKNAKRYFPLIGGSALFIFFSNLLALVPGMNPPTANLNITVACAVTVFIAFNYYGLKENGWSYIAHMAGPKWYLAWLIFPIEVISTLVRPVTLSIRLFMNMAVDHLLVSIALGMIAFLVPVPVMLLGVIVIVVQTLVFTLLTSIYIGLATEHAEGAH